MKSRKNQSQKSQRNSREARLARQKMFRRIMRMESLEDRIVLHGDHGGGDHDHDEPEGVPFYQEPIPGSGVSAELQYFLGDLIHGDGSTSPPASNFGPGESGPTNFLDPIFNNNPDAPTYVLDFNDPGQPDTTDMFGNVVSTFDPTDFGFAATDFDLVANGVLDAVEDFWHHEVPTAPITGIPEFHELDVNFVIGDIGTPPVGFAEYYYIQIGTEGSNPSGTVGVACLGCVRDVNGNGPNFGVQVGDVIGSFFTDGLGFVGIPAGDLDVTSHVVGTITSHELGHATSLQHVEVAGAVTPLNIGTPIMATPALDLTIPQILSPAEWALSGMEGGAPRQSLPDLITALGTRLHSANIAEGTVYQDDNENGVQDAGEVGLAGWEVFIDLDNNGTLDAGEPFDTSAADGSYAVRLDLGVGTFTLREVVQPGFLPTVPAGGVTTVTFTSPVETISDINFGNVEDPAVLSGFKWIDADLDGRYDPDTEVPGAGFRMYLDLNNNDRLDFNETSAVTDAAGNYSLRSPGAGTFTVREATPPGFTQTFPASGEHTVTLVEFESAKGLNFGNSGQLHDFGSAPPSYGSLLADDGGRHRMLSGFQLGTLLAGETDSINAVVADNDGTVFNQRMTAGNTSSFDVTVMTSGHTPGYLQAWVDFDGSGTFEASEQIVTNDRRGDGTHTIPFTVPVTATTGTTWARVRYGWEFNLGPNGEAFAGEIEDKMVNVFGDDPQAIDDFFDGANAIAQDSPPVNLDVLVNDFASSAGGLVVDAVQNPSVQGGTVTIAGDSLSVFYQPPAGFFGSDSFTYTIRDAADKTSTATVNVVVAPAIAGPDAKDDVHFFPDFPLNASTDIPVLQNDFSGSDGPIRISQITSNPSLGSAVILNNGTSDPTDDVIQYTPFNGSANNMTDMFEYEILDTLGQASTASVLVQIGDAAADNMVEITLVAFDPVLDIPISTVQVGQEFELRAFINDIRPAIPSNGPELNGMFSGYFDVTVNKPTPTSNVYSATFIGQPTPTSFYPEGTNGDTLSPGEVNEAGGVQPVQINGTVQSHGKGPIHIWSQMVRADQPGNLIFQPNPSDDVDLLTLYFDPPEIAEIQDISYIPHSLIATAGSGEGEGFHNTGMAGDVDGSGNVDARDPLLLINKYVHEGEGESQESIMWDVVQDEMFRIDDIIAAIGYFRHSHLSRNGGSAEGEFVLVQPLGSPLNPVLADQFATTQVVAAAPVSQHDASTQQQPERRSQVVQAESEGLSEQQRFEIDDAISGSALDRWRATLDSTLNDDLLLDISSNWIDEDE